MKKIVITLFLTMCLLASAAVPSKEKIEQLKSQLAAMGVKKVSINDYEKAIKTLSVVEAEKYLKKAIKSDAKNTYAKDDLAVIYIGAGKPSEAASLLVESINANPKNYVPYVNLLSAYNNLNNVSGYENTLAALIRNIPDYAEGYRLAAFYMRNRKDYATAGKYIDAAINTYHTTTNKYPEIFANKNNLLADMYSLRVVNLVELGQYQNAIDSFVNYRGYIALNKSHEQGLLTVLRNANESFRNNPMYQTNLRNLGLLR